MSENNYDQENLPLPRRLYEAVDDTDVPDAPTGMLHVFADSDTDPPTLSVKDEYGTVSVFGTTPAASDTQAGAVELATPAEVITGTATDLAVTPEGFAAAFLSGLRAMLSRRFGRITSVVGGTTFAVAGLPAIAPSFPTNVGATGAAANADTAAVGPFVTVGSSANTINDSAAVASAFTQTRRDWVPEVEFRVLTVGVTGIRLHVGLFSASPDQLASLATLSAAAFGYDTGVDGTAFWRCRSGDTATQEETVTTVAVAPAVAYTMRIALGASEVNFYINDVLVATHTAHLPVATTLLGYGAYVTALASAAQGKKIAVGRITLTQI